MSSTRDAPDHAAWRRRSRLIGAGLLGAAILAALGVLALVLSGISAREQPGTLEVTLARSVRHLAIPKEARRSVNPLRNDQRVLAQGMAHFADHCASCHANDGSGTTELGRGLYPRPPDMRLPETQRLSDGELFYIIENGIRLSGMPAWGGAGAPEESWKLVHFVRHLPRLTGSELQQMERMNPRSPAEWRELQEEDRFLNGDASPGPAMDHAR